MIHHVRSAVVAFVKIEKILLLEWSSHSSLQTYKDSNFPQIVRSPSVANLWAVVLPWAVALPTTTIGHGASLQDLLNYGSLLFGSVVNFILPFILYLGVQRRLGTYEAEGYLGNPCSLAVVTFRATVPVPM